MLCFDVNLKIRFDFELQNTKRAMVECNICDKHFNLNESLKCHGIEVHVGKQKHFKEAFEYQFEGCGVEKVQTRPGEEFGAPQVLF